jgi:hypothetical protein
MSEITSNAFLIWSTRPLGGLDGWMDGRMDGWMDGRSGGSFAFACFFLLFQGREGGVSRATVVVSLWGCALISKAG